MQKLLPFLFFVFLSSIFSANAQTPDANGIVYVKPTATGSGNGTSWENATGNLQDAIDATGVTKVFVAVGNYNVGDHSFTMKNDVEIYGGFNPVNDLTDWNTRFLPNKQTGYFDIDNLSGSVMLVDLGWDFPFKYNNVVSNSGLNNTAVLDGFTITGGSNPTGADGGGIQNVNSSPTLRNLLITTNSAVRGGGIFNLNSSPVVTNVIINYNEAFTNFEGEEAMGGAVYNAGNSSPIFTNTLIIGNWTITNLALNNGGGVYHTGTGTATFINCTLHNNRSGGWSPVSMANSVTVNSGSASFINSIVYGGITGSYTAQYSMIEGNTDFSNGNINATDFSENFINPISGLTASNLGNYGLIYTSLAINAGNNTLFPNLNVNTTDIVGNTRAMNHNNTGLLIDMGAYESSYIPILPTNGIIYVKPVATGEKNGSSWDNAISDLHTAIKVSGVTKVFVAIGNYNVGERSYILKNNVEIYGGFDPDYGISELSHNRVLPNANIGSSVLNGQYARTIIFNHNNGVNNTAIIDGFTLKNGRGGIYNSGASPTLRNLYITGNQTDYGGGIYNSNSSPVISNVVFDGNRGKDGAGIYNILSSPALTDVVFKNNIADQDGGGINNYNNSSPVMTNVKFQNNKADYGGGVFNRKSSPAMNNVEITDNIANRDAGGIYNDDNSSPIITNMKLTGNKANNANGGGVYNRTNSSPFITNALIANNTAVSNGGAIRNEANSSPKLHNVTIANNTGQNIIYATDGNTIINNSVVYGTITATYTAQYSLIESNTNFTNGNINATGITLTDIFTNPLSDDYTLKSGSVAINAGNNALFAGLNANTKDLAGNPRLDGVIDMGAYEHITTLPVTLIGFTAKADGSRTKLQWQTASELNNKGFEIYRSSDDKQFVKIGEVWASHISNLTSRIYSFFDSSPLNGNNYYQLIQIDNDGKETDLGIRTVNFGFQPSDIQLYPNPTADLVTLSFAQGAFTQLQVIDINGRILQQHKLSVTESSKQVSLVTYPAGIYMISLNGNGKIESRRVIKKPF